MRMLRGRAAHGVQLFLQHTDRIAGWLQWMEAQGPVGHLYFALFYVACTLVMVPASILEASAGFLYGPLWGIVIASALGAPRGDELVEVVDPLAHLAADLARARADVDTAKTSLAEANLEIDRLRPALALAEEKIRAREREYAGAKDQFEKEISSLRSELASSRAVRDALEPRVEQLGAELAEARAEAKVAKAA